MAVGKSVQFNNVENVVGAYHLRQVPAFSIMQGNQFMVSYDGQDMDEGETLLREFCNMISQSAAIYTICVYEEFTGKINAKTPYHGSFNFRFNGLTEFQKVNGLDSIHSELRAMNERIEQLSREKIKEEIEEDETDNSAMGTMDKIAGILSHPLVQQLAPVIIGMITKNNGMEKNNELIENKISGVPGMQSEISENLYNALCEMMVVVPDVEKHLIKLGNLAKNNPDKFKSILGYMAFI